MSLRTELYCNTLSTYNNEYKYKQLRLLIKSLKIESEKGESEYIVYTRRLTEEIRKYLTFEGLYILDIGNDLSKITWFT